MKQFLKTFAVPVFLIFWTTTPSIAQDKTIPLDAKLIVSVDPQTLQPSCQFQTPGKADQSFDNTEYHYAILDQEGVQVNGALMVQLPLRMISLPKDKRSVTDKTDAKIMKEKLKPGVEYYFVVSVRNLTGLTKFTPKAAATPNAKPIALYRAEQKNMKVTLFATGQNSTGGWQNNLTVLPIDVSPPEFRFVQIKPTGIVTTALKPFAVDATVTAPKQLDFVYVTDAAGKHKVTVTQK